MRYARFVSILVSECECAVSYLDCGGNRADVALRWRDREAVMGDVGMEERGWSCCGRWSVDLVRGEVAGVCILNARGGVSGEAEKTTHVCKYSNSLGLSNTEASPLFSALVYGKK